MCGVCGFISDSGEPSREIAQIVALQNCRGPDDCGFWRGMLSGSASVGLGHNRLSIIDRSQHGHQPMLSPNGKIALSFNGEIYNYREIRPQLEAMGWTFSSQSDTEVLLAAYALWGTDAWERLNGMFALAVVDLSEGYVHLVRSRVGSKPLAFVKYSGGWLFASTADSLARVTGADIDLGYVAQGMASWAYDGASARTPFVGVHQVLPGRRMTFSLQDPSREPTATRWYSLADRVAAAEPLAPADAVDAVRACLIDSVGLRLRSDVPVGVSLSGGLDSTSVAALASLALEAPLDAYSYRWGEQDTDAIAASNFAQHLGVSGIAMNWVDPPSRVDLPGVMHRTIVAQGAPFGGLSVVAQNLVFAQARRQGTGVMLGGQGADEIFLGYRKFQAAHLRAQIGDGHYLKSACTGAEFLRAIYADRSDYRSYSAAARRYLRRDKRGQGSLIPVDLDLPSVPLSDPAALSLADVEWNSLPTLLRFEDRNSMSASIESRLPFLDYRLVELALSLPTGLKVHRGWGKWVLREAMASWLPKSIAWSRSKKGFNAGDARWIALGVGEWLRGRISDGAEGLIHLGIDRSTISGGIDLSDGNLRADPDTMHQALVLAWLVTWQEELARPLENPQLPPVTSVCH